MIKRSIRVLHAAKSLGLGGTEKVMQQFVTTLDASRYHTAVFAFADGERGPQLREQGITTYIQQDFLAVLDQFKPDIVHVHRAGWAEEDLLAPIKRARIPIVVETNVFGRHDPSPLGKIIDHHLFVSRFCLERFYQTTTAPKAPECYSFLYNPVDTDFFAHHCKKRPISPPAAGRISRPDSGKWSALALDFLPYVIKEIPDFEYHIIGGIDAAHEYVASNNLQNNVQFHPPVQTDQELADFLGSVSVLAHANDTGESFGLVIAEAMACGLPVVTHPCPGLRDNAQLELVDHGKTGFIAQNAQEYAQAVLWLLRHPEQAGSMGKAGQEKAAKLYRKQVVTAQLEQLYESLLREKLSPSCLC